MRRLIALLFLLFLPALARADPVMASKILTGDELELSGGTHLRLEGIMAPVDDTNARAAADKLSALALGRAIEMENPSADRYGRSFGQAYALDGANKIWLQGELLKAGLVFVYPPVGSEPRLDEMIAAEQDARKAQRGIWASDAYKDIPADAAPDHIGQFAFVSGKIVDAARVKNKVYLNFGADWHNDFTVAIAAHDLHFFRKAKLDPLALKDKTIRVRGWVRRDFGPMIMVTHPSQIEIIQ